MERIIDFLAEREEKQAAKRAQKAAKKERIAKLLKNVDAAQSQPVIDFLGD